MDIETRAISAGSSSTPSTLKKDPDDEQVVVFASSPFGNPDADVILRTSDVVAFRVFKIVLALASPFFKDMFSLPQHMALEDRGGIPIVSIPEDSGTIDLLLRFCYPVTSPRLAEKEVSVIGNVLAAALKYDVRVAIESAGEALSTRAQASRKDALAAYAVACHFRLEEQTRIAARACLRWPVLGLVVPELVLASALDYCNLLDFHTRASEAAVALFSQYDFLVNTCAAINPPSHPESSHWEHLSGSVSDTPGAGRLIIYTWWAVAKTSITESLRGAPLGTEKLSYSELTVCVEAECNECHICKNQILRGWEEAREAIIAAVKDAVSKVSARIFSSIYMFALMVYQR